MRKAISRKKAAMIDIEQACNKISQPEVPFALRLSGILMGKDISMLSKYSCFKSHVKRPTVCKCSSVGTWSELLDLILALAAEYQRASWLCTPARWPFFSRMPILSRQVTPLHFGTFFNAFLFLIMINNYKYSVHRIMFTEISILYDSWSYSIPLWSWRKRPKEKWRQRKI